MTETGFTQLARCFRRAPARGADQRDGTVAIAIQCGENLLDKRVIGHGPDVVEADARRSGGNPGFTPLRLGADIDNDKLRVLQKFPGFMPRDQPKLWVLRPERPPNQAGKHQHNKQDRSAMCAPVPGPAKQSRHGIHATS